MAKTGANSGVNKKSNEFPRCRGPSSFDADGKLVGKDPFGNKYYEIPADPRWVGTKDYLPLTVKFKAISD